MPVAPTDCLQELLEDAGYLEVGGEHLYTVLHKVANPIARVLMAGPFAAERQYSYIPWVRWARYLAQRRIEVLRFDYRGVGESTGKFEEMNFETWREDAQTVASWFQQQSPGLPLILHGLELGALLAAKTLAAGIGSAGLFWSPPRTANEVLRSSLKHQIAIDNAFNTTTRKPASHYIQQLDEGETMEVEGYRWSESLWRQSYQLEMPSGDAGDWHGGKPVRFVQLDKRATPLIGTSGLRFVSTVNPDLSELFAENYHWIVNTPGLTR